MEEMQPFFTDSTNIDTSVGVSFVVPKSQLGHSKSVHNDVFVEAGETGYVNTLTDNANAMIWICMA